MIWSRHFFTEDERSCLFAISRAWAISLRWPLRIVSIHGLVRDLPELTRRLDALSADDALAWRWFACTLLAEELVEE